MDIHDDPPDDAEIARTIEALASAARSSDVAARHEATQKLYDLSYAVGNRAAAAVPILIERIADADDQIGESAMWGLHYCAPDSIEPLIDTLASRDAKTRDRACHALGNIGEEALPAADMLRRLLEDPDSAVRKRAAWALGLIKDTTERTIDALSKMARGEEDAERAAALHALGNIGKELDGNALRGIEPDVLHAVDDADRDVRRSACHALPALHLDAPRHAALLARRLRDEPDEDVRYWLADQLKSLAAETDLSEHLPLMCDVVRARDRASRTMCEVIGVLGPSAQAAAHVLIDVLDDEDGFLVVAAAEALWAVTRRADELLPALSRIFEDNGESVCDAICMIGPAAAPLAPKLIDALATEDYWDLQWAAADALGAVASDDPQIISALANALGHESPIVKSAASRALARVGEPAVSALVDILNNDPGARGEWAADALGKIGPPAAGATDALRKQLHAGGALSTWCAIALARVAGDPGVLPALTRLLEHERADLRREAALALKAIGPPAVSALDALRAALDDEDADVRAAAEEAVSALTAQRH